MVFLVYHNGNAFLAVNKSGGIAFVFYKLGAYKVIFHKANRLLVGNNVHVVQREFVHARNARGDRPYNFLCLFFAFEMERKRIAFEISRKTHAR